MKANKSTMTLALLLAVAAAGCVGRVRQPEGRLAGVSVGGFGLRGATLLAELDIINPNDFDIETDSIAYEMEASEPGSSATFTRVTQATYTQRIKVDDNGHSKVEIPIEFNYTGLSGALRGIMDKGTFNYRVRGNVYVREPLKRTIPFSKSGNMSLAGAR